MPKLSTRTGSVLDARTLRSLLRAGKPGWKARAPAARFSMTQYVLVLLLKILFITFILSLIGERKAKSSYLRYCHRERRWTNLRPPPPGSGWTMLVHWCR
jgi:hypothetical protein